MDESAADCGQRSILDCIASVSMSSWMCDEEKAKKEFGEMTRASVKKEMAKPRMAKSARCWN
jgi:hypothetical protein